MGIRIGGNLGMFRFGSSPCFITRNVDCQELAQLTNNVKICFPRAMLNWETLREKDNFQELGSIGHHPFESKPSQQGKRQNTTDAFR